MTDMASGNVVERMGYRPFGEQRSHSGSAVLTNYKFTDQEFDPETGLYYYGARYYDPTLGRFIQADSVVQDGRINCSRLIFSGIRARGEFLRSS